MKNKYFLLSVSFLLIIAVIIHIFSTNAMMVEKYYSLAIFPKIALFLTFLNRIVSFSIGDIFYGCCFLWLFAFILRIIWLLFKGRIRKQDVVVFFKKTIFISLWIYIVFNLLWGINYNRMGITYQLGFSLQPYNKVELIHLNEMLLQKVNESKTVLLNNEHSYSHQQIFSGAVDAYHEVENIYPFLINSNVQSVKSSMWGWLGNYSGFLGYYNPFTGEAQVNTTIPDYIQAYTTCHEIAHQLGYAKENEANFVGYLACSASKDTFFRYSVYLDMFVYSNRNLFAVDSLAAKQIGKQLLPSVKTDIVNWRKFLLNHQSPIEPVVRWVYGKYLQENQQPAGVYSYDEVSGFLIGYYKKFGKI